MADYKRIVSYVYNYEFGQKKNNVGYSRVESKNNQCKVTIHLNTNMLAGQSLKVYLYYHSQSMLEGIYLGEMSIKNGTGDFRTVTNSSFLMDTDVSVEDINGVIIYSDENCYLGSQWDDEEIQINNFREYSKKIQEEAVMKPAKMVPERKKEEVLPEYIAEEKKKIDEDLQVPVKEEDKKEEQTVADNNNLESEMMDDSEEKLVETSQEKQVSEVDFKEDKNLEDVHKGEEQKLNLENEEESERKAYPDCVKSILKNFPMLKPFPNSVPENWVRIEPKDIGMLPVESWILANNSFLLHGYYNYRHLIFGVLKMEDEDQFVIGVPGMLHQTEQVMANMFGFHRFMSSNNVKGNQVNFGYWIQQIVL